MIYFRYIFCYLHILLYIQKYENNLIFRLIKELLL